MKRAQRLLTIILLTNSPLSISETRDWQVNEVFLQLSELRKEITLLKKEVSKLKKNWELLSQRKKDEIQQDIKIDLSGSVPLGNNTAKYAIVEFTDYQCPYCYKHAKKTFPIIKHEYIDKGRLKYFIKDYPLDFHRLARKAATSVRCAGKQGKYWDMHSVIFDNQKHLTNDSFLTFANQLKIGTTSFTECMDDPLVIKEIEKDLVLGNSIGVQGTPAFFIGKIENNNLVNVKKLFGAHSFSSFRKIIEHVLAE